MAVADKIFAILKLSQEIVDLHRDHLSDESLTGVVADFSDEFVYLSLFSDAGLANGICVVYRADITRMRWSGNERRSIAQLVEASGAKAERPPVALDSIQSVLRSVSAAFGYVNVLIERANDSITFIGEIVELDHDSLVLETYGTFTSRDRGKLMLACDEITRVDAGAAYEKSVSYLASLKSQGSHQ